MLVKEIMTKKVITVKEDDPISRLAELLFDENLTGVPVVDDSNHVMGIVTEHDFISREKHIHIPTYVALLSQFKTMKKDSSVTQELERIQSLKVKDLMTHPVVTLSQETNVSEAARIFSEDRINPLPVVNKDGALVGIISRADIVNLFRTLSYYHKH